MSQIRRKLALVTGREIPPAVHEAEQWFPYFSPKFSDGSFASRNAKESALKIDARWRKRVKRSGV
jgi:hypothetical protein